ncbi:aldo/keto reductase [Ideonella sp.]|jgi:aryl-alcohol dehydrogenase-like predicted oxidoreductase|uniref:aldo/keto reductase n=1 Tax=Ideonella sp. TaxID=1929293 RepID=UPI0037C09AD7
MTHRPLGAFQVSPIGLGCMNLSHAYGAPPSAEQARALLQQALDEGYTLFDTAALYGFGANELLVGPSLKPFRQRITLCSKGGMAGMTGADGQTTRVIDGRPEALRRNCEDSLRRLGTDVIDLYYLHRWDKRVPIEESVGEMSRLVAEGKVRALGLSEVSATTLRRAHAVHPIAALQSEYSLWTRNPEIAVLQTCRELGVAFVAFSPVARGFLGSLTDVSKLDAKDIRRSMPRFAPVHYAANLGLLAPVQALAAELGCTVAQVALAWLLHQGKHIIPIPGTTHPQHLSDNLAASRIALSEAHLACLAAAINQHTVQGTRYNSATQAEIDTEEFGAAT